MSSGWELVSRKKDRGNDKSNKLTKAEKKKFIENAPKVEDFLPLSQVQTLYDNLNGNKENNKSAKAQGKEHKTKENEEKKKQQQQQKQQQQAEKKKQEPKEKPPKTIKDALNAINVQEVDELLTTAQIRYPEAPLLWLKELNAFLNIKIPISKEDTIFSGKPKDYPLSLVPKAISSILELAVEIAGQQTIQVFYENTLTAMAIDMVKGVPVIGHKIFLQLLAHLNPEMTAANIPKLTSVWNSYENRKNIGLSLLWAWSQAGQKNLAVGLKIWHEVMSPMLDTKGYAGYVVQILNDLVFGHDNVHDLSLDLYLTIIMKTYSEKFQTIQPANLGKEIITSFDKLRSILFRNKDISYTKFEILMGKVSQKSDPNYRHELVKALADCLVTEPLCFTIWNSIYTKHLYQSSLLLSYIDTNLPLQTKLKAKHLKETLGLIQNNNEKWKKAKDENLALACKKTSQALSKKMTSSTRRSFPWKSGSFLLLLLIGAIVAYDTQKHGSFEASQIGMFLKTNGILKYIEKAWTTLKLYWSAGHKAIKDSSPEYYKAVVDLSTPYIKLAGDVYLITRNISVRLYSNVAAYVEKNIPIVFDTIEYYAPGIIDEIKSKSLQGLEFVKVSCILIGEKVIEHSRATIQWMEQNVFVGKLSPDNLRSYAIWAFDTTQSYASQTYDWVYEKVQTLSKVP